MVGRKVTLVDSPDPTKRGRSGEVVLETANTLILQAGAERITVEKRGTVFLPEGSKEPVIGDDVSGRLEDRLRWRKR